MGTRSAKLALTVGVPIALLLLGGAAGAESKGAPGGASEVRGESVAPESDDGLRQRQESALEAEVGDPNDVAAQLKETLRQLDGAREEQEKSLEEEKTRAEELKRRESKKKASVGTLGTDKEQQMAERIEQLEVAEEAGEIQVPPASGSGGGGLGLEQELYIAREEIVAQPVEKIPYKRYIQIYKAAAKRYGFAEDWYVLVAVGKAESNHGENMGPSSAGAMGPMQFLPSTWQQFGVDGNGDGIANIMIPKTPYRPPPHT